MPIHERFLGPNAAEIFAYDRASPPQTLRVINAKGEKCTYLCGAGPSPDVFADPLPLALTSGTVTVTQGNMLVVGAGTVFLTDFEVGDTFCLNADGSGLIGVVAQVVDNTNLNLANPWPGETLAGVAAYNAAPRRRNLPAYGHDLFVFPNVVMKKRFVLVQAGPLAEIQFKFEAGGNVAQFERVRESPIEFQL